MMTSRIRQWAFVAGGLIVGYLLVRSAFAPQARPHPLKKAEREVSLPRARISSVLPKREPRAAPPQTTDEPRLPVMPMNLHPRSKDEWQGMLVNVGIKPPCDVSSRCGLARACIDGRCGPCARDGECRRGEVCVLDHCLKREQVSCRTRRDCRESASLCLLTGYSADPRGNSDMHATCVSAKSGKQRPSAPQTPAGLEPDAGAPTTESETLLEELRGAKSSTQQ